MKTIKWLLLREYWENPGMLVRANLALLALLLGLSTIFVFVSGHDWWVKTLAVAAGDQRQIGGLTQLIMGILNACRWLFSILLTLLVYSYSVSAFAEERKSRSILFWKSLPLSDAQAVMSKLIFAIVLLPLAALFCLMVTTSLIALIFCAYFSSYGIALFPALFAADQFWAFEWKLLSQFPFYMLWALPNVAWLMLVSSVLKNRVGMWAILMPIGVVMLIRFVNQLAGGHLDLNGLGYALVYRSLCSIAPGSWMAQQSLMNQANIYTKGLQQIDTSAGYQTYELLAGADLWIGVAAGMLMLVLAWRARRWQE